MSALGMTRFRAHFRENSVVFCTGPTCPPVLEEITAKLSSLVSSFFGGVFVLFLPYEKSVPSKVSLSTGC